MSRLSLTVIESTNELNEKVGGLSQPGKVPWYSTSISAFDCKTGSKLAKVPGSVCHGCYSRRGNYLYNTVQKALRRRLRLLKKDPDAWADNMARLLKRKARKFWPTETDKWPAFRVNDSGDLQGVWYLAAITRLARQLKRVRLADGSVRAIRLWLPTREYGFVTDYFEGGGTIPKNLNIRLSAHMIDGPLPMTLARKYGLTVSGVTKDPNLVTCPAPTQDNQCGECRRCWNKQTSVVYYKKH